MAWARSEFTWGYKLTRHVDAGTLEVVADEPAVPGRSKYRWAVHSDVSVGNGPCDSIVQGKGYAQEAMDFLIGLEDRRRQPV